MKGLIKARGICVRISIVMDTAQHKASTRSSLLLAVADRALCTHTALPMPCYLKNGINEPRSWSGRPWCHSSSRRAHRVLPDSRSAAFAYVVYNLLGIGCPRRSRSLRCGEQCIASRSMSNGYITSALW